MKSNQLTNCELFNLLEIIHKLARIDSKDQFMIAALSAAELIEYDSIMFWLPGPSLHKNQAVADININFPKDWVDLYHKNNLCQIDPVVLATRKQHIPQQWIDIYRRFPPDDYFLDLAHEYGLRDGWSCLTKGTSDLPWSIISIGGDYKKTNKARVEYILARLAPHFHNTLASLTTKLKPKKNKTRKPQNLTIRQHEVLKWLSRGKTSWEISMILRVSEATINFHVSNLKTKLNTVNRSQTVAVAKKLYGL